MSGGNVLLAGVASTPTPTGAIDTDGLLNAQVVGDTVRRVCAELDPKITQVVMGVTNCSLVARVMEIPPVPQSEIRSVLRGEMDHYRILPAGQSAFDFFRLPDPPERPDAPMEEPVARVLLMGAEERVVTAYRSVADAANLGVSAVEPGSIALLRALYPMLRVESGVASVIVSATGTDIFITQQGDLQFYRRIDTGIPELRTHVAQAPTVAPVGQLLGGEEEMAEPAAPAVAAVDPSSGYNRQAISLLMTEIQRSIDFYIREFPSATDTMLVRFAVDTPDATDLFNVMTQYLRSGAQMASVTDTVAVSNEAAAILRGPEGFRFTVAVGLALRGAPGYEPSPALDLAVGDRVIVERRMAPKALLASAAASAVILLGTGVASIVVGHSIARAERTLTQTQIELNSVKAQTAAKVAQLERQKNLTTAIHVRHKPIREAIDFIAASIAQHASLQVLAFDQTGTISIAGEAPTPRLVADLMDTINVCPMLEPIRLNNLARVDPGGGAASSIKFELQTGFIAPQAQASVPASGAEKQGGS